MAKNNLNRHSTLANGKVCYLEIPAIEIVQPIGLDAPEVTARFSDPAGNVK